MATATPDLPEAFCWTRFGAEAGQPMAEILARKESERLANKGLFLWGIGNAIAPGIRELVQLTPDPLVLFSPIRSQPRLADRVPQRVVAWTKADAMDGSPFEIPSGSLVTSRLDPVSPKPYHYALVCRSTAPLGPDGLGSHLDMGWLRNLTTGSRVGWSQVTAVVRVTTGTDAMDSGTYPISWMASLATPYLIRLHHPAEVEIGAMLEVVKNGVKPVDLASCLR